MGSFFKIWILKNHLPVSVLYREQMQKVFVGLERRRVAVEGQQIVDVAVQVL